MKWVRIVAQGMLLLLGVFDMFLQTRIHLFQQIYADAFPGRPLPEITDCLLHAQTFSLALAVLLTLAVLYAISRVRGSRQEWILIGATLLLLAHLVFTTVALFFPFRLGIITGMAP